MIENLAEGVRKDIVKVSLTIDLLATSVLFLLPMFELFERAIWDEQRDFGRFKGTQWAFSLLLNQNFF